MSDLNQNSGDIVPGTPHRCNTCVEFRYWPVRIHLTVTQGCTVHLPVSEQCYNMYACMGKCIYPYYHYSCMYASCMYASMGKCIYPVYCMYACPIQVQAREYFFKMVGCQILRQKRLKLAAKLGRNMPLACFEIVPVVSQLRGTHRNFLICFAADFSSFPESCFAANFPHLLGSGGWSLQYPSDIRDM